MNNEEFKAQRSSQKGDIGEDIAVAHLEAAGYKVIKPFFEGPHRYDLVIMDQSDKVLMIGDVKTKSRLNKWYATGFDTKDIPGYLAMEEEMGVPFIVIFVDQKDRCMYYTGLSFIINKSKGHVETCWPNGVEYKSPITYPLIFGFGDDETTSFPVKYMIHMKNLTDEDVLELRRKTDSNYEN